MKIVTAFLAVCACIAVIIIGYQVGTGINESTSGPSQAQVAAREAKVKAAIKDQTVFVGMTPDEAEASWGKPLRINRTTTANGAREQWVYKNNNYLYFQGGRLTTIQN